jgi:hypothetical protein
MDDVTDRDFRRFPVSAIANARYLHDRVENVPGRSRYNGYPL